MALGDLILVYLVLTLVAVCGGAWYADRQRRHFEPEPTDDSVFRCEKCGYVYTDDHDVDRSRCPQCGTGNQAFQF